MNFAKMSKGWAQGGDAFRAGLLKSERDLSKNLKLGVSEAKELREAMWEQRVRDAIQLLEQKGIDMSNQRKFADWNVAIPAILKTKCLCRNGWLSERLGMGVESAVSRNCAELEQGLRPGARKVFNLINANSKD